MQNLDVFFFLSLSLLWTDDTARPAICKHCGISERFAFKFVCVFDFTFSVCCDGRCVDFTRVRKTRRIISDCV